MKRGEDGDSLIARAEALEAEIARQQALHIRRAGAIRHLRREIAALRDAQRLSPRRRSKLGTLFDAAAVALVGASTVLALMQMNGMRRTAPDPTRPADRKAAVEYLGAPISGGHVP